MAYSTDAPPKALRLGTVWPSPEHLVSNYGSPARGDSGRKSIRARQCRAESDEHLQFGGGLTVKLDAAGRQSARPSGSSVRLRPMWPNGHMSCMIKVF